MLTFALQLAGIDVGNLLVWLVVLAGCVAVVLIATRAMGVAVPPWLVQILWVVAVVVVAALAIRLILSV